MLEELSNEEILARYLLPPSLEQVFAVCYACREFSGQQHTIGTSWNKGRSQGQKGRIFADKDAWYFELVFDLINPTNFINLEAVPKKLRSSLKRAFNYSISRRELIDWLVGYCIFEGYIVVGSPQLSNSIVLYLTDKGFEVVNDNVEDLKCFYTARVLTRGLVIVESNE
jgi:hypothetical protein